MADGARQTMAGDQHAAEAWARPAMSRDRRAAAIAAAMTAIPTQSRGRQPRRSGAPLRPGGKPARQEPAA